MTDQESPVQEEQKTDSIAELFAERDSALVSDHTSEPEKIAANEGTTKPEATKNESQIIDTPDLKNLQAELEKTKKAFADTQKYGHSNARKIKAAQKNAKMLVENGSLSDEEARFLSFRP